jgi:hypothetical protein
MPTSTLLDLKKFLESVNDTFKVYFDFHRFAPCDIVPYRNSIAVVKFSDDTTTVKDLLERVSEFEEYCEDLYKDKPNLGNYALTVGKVTWDTATDITGFCVPLDKDYVILITRSKLC